MHRKTVSTKNDVMFHMIRRETIPNTNVTSTKQKVLQKKKHTHLNQNRNERAIHFLNINLKI